jgi:dethiobiotin synthetase
MALFIVIRGYFVTGTDTEVGKTVASCALLQAANAAGMRCAGYKPVASGSEMTPEGWRNSDVVALQKNSNIALSHHEVNIYSFAQATAPHIASQQEQKPISLAALSAGSHHLAQRTDWLVVEGAGGWFTPLAEQQTFADWVQQEQLPVILVVGVKLGCINHALLTQQAIRQAGLPLAGWIANQITEPATHHQPYLATLRRMLAAPMLGEIPHLQNVQSQPLGHYLDINLLKT